MNPNALLADPESLEIEKFVSEADLITIVIHSILSTASCPNCHQSSSSLKTRYSRSIADLPWHGVKIKLLLKVRKFRCGNFVVEMIYVCDKFFVNDYQKWLPNTPAGLFDWMKLFLCWLLGSAVGKEQKPHKN